MGSSFDIRIDWERLNEGPPEEIASFGAIGIHANGVCLTEAEDAFVKRVRTRVHLSGYQLAQWLAWNWWRLRWEPERRTVDWAMAHRLTTIGGGYVWPNLSCSSDGKRLQLTAHSQPRRPAEPLRYVSETSQVVPWADFEDGVDRFVEQVLANLRSQDVGTTALADIWDDVRKERRDDAASRYRSLEASIGFDPDEAESALIDALRADEEVLGADAVRELAADSSPDHPPLTSETLNGLAKNCGFDADFANCPSAPDVDVSDNGSPLPAWQLGERIAHGLRTEEQLGSSPLDDSRLSKLLGLDPAAFAAGAAKADRVSFAMKYEASKAIVVLHSPIRVSRRFAAARLLGDLLAMADGDALLPAMRSRTYRQKVQRAFAAELLCPFTEIETRLRDDEANQDRQEEIASEFGVSPMVVRTLLVNKGLLPRTDLPDF